jgi:hypothetical protein
MKSYTFEVIITEGNDEWWESNPSDKDVTRQLKDILEEFGFEDNCYVTLRKFENVNQ